MPIVVAPLAGAWIEMYEFQFMKDFIESLPSRERGLKFPELEKIYLTLIVAPLAGAWIEMQIVFCFDKRNVVAPLAGAWIEIPSNIVEKVMEWSLPSRERGLKLWKVDNT